MKENLGLGLIPLLFVAATVLAEGPTAYDRAARAEVYLKIRLQYAESTDYNPYASGLYEIRRKSNELLDKGDFEGAIQEAAKGLAIDRLNIRLLMTQAAAYRAKGDLQKANETRQTWTSLIDSIISHGDGKSFETAFQVISTEEEYAVMIVAFGLDRGEQGLFEYNGSYFDVFTVQSGESGDESKLFFNVDIPFRWLLQHPIDEKRSETNQSLQPAPISPE